MTMAQRHLGLLVAVLAATSICCSAQLFGTAGQPFPTLSQPYGCALPQCGPPPTLHVCQNLKDEKGCATCDYVCGYGPRFCPPKTCNCPYGGGLTHYDQAGCETCTCYDFSRGSLWGWGSGSAGLCLGWPQCPQGRCPNSCQCRPKCDYQPYGVTPSTTESPED